MIASARMTEAEFDALPYEEGRHWDLVEGEILEVPTANAKHQEVVARILVSLWQHLQSAQSGGILPDVASPWDQTYVFVPISQFFFQTNGRRWHF